MQALIPVYPTDTKMINTKIGIQIIHGKTIYFNSDVPIYRHDKDDYQSFRYITSQMIALKTIRQAEIISLTLQIQPQPKSTRHEDLILYQLCEYLNETETISQGTDLKLQYFLVWKKESQKVLLYWLIII